jgi:pectate lyase
VDGLSLGPATSQVQVPVQISSPNVTLRNVAISGAASAYIGIRIWSSSNVAVSNCTIDGLGSKTGASGVGILVKGGTNVLISGNVLGNSGEADVEVQDGWDGTHSNVVAITGNRFANSWGSSLIVDKGQIGVTTNGNSGAN